MMKHDYASLRDAIKGFMIKKGCGYLKKDE